METRSGFGYAEISLDKHASVVDRASYDDMLDVARRGDVDDVIVLAHGWNNDAADARDLYSRMAERLRGVIDSGAAGPLGLAGRRVALVGVLWPSKKFAESDLIPGGAASVGSPVADAALLRQLADLHGVFDSPGAEQALHEAVRLVPALDDSPQARDDFVDAVRGLLPQSATEDRDDLPEQLVKLPGREVLDRLSAPLLPAGPASVPSGDAATALGFSFGGVKAGAQRLLNLLTYYQMKERAGVVGATASTVLRELRDAPSAIGIHLVGHSFGGRLVTAAALGGAADPLRPDSMTLLQAAFSHYSFARAYDGEHDGFFRRVVNDAMVPGPVLVTHSAHDIAVGLAYPLASRLARQAANWLGDANDRYGGLGRNGAQKTPESVNSRLLPVGAGYQLVPRVINNLHADDVIADHNDVTGPEVAYAILAAVASRAGGTPPGP